MRKRINQEASKLAIISKSFHQYLPKKVCGSKDCISVRSDPYPIHKQITMMKQYYAVLNMKYCTINLYAQQVKKIRRLNLQC